MTSAPVISLNPRIIDSGGSEEPETRRTPERSGGCGMSFIIASIGAKIAGAPLASVTFSSMKARAIAPNSSAANLPGRTSFAPAATAFCGKPHERTWNIGVIGMTVSLNVAPRAARPPIVWR